MPLNWERQIIEEQENEVGISNAMISMLRQFLCRGVIRSNGSIVSLTMKSRAYRASQSGLSL